jgi:SAM-dependent methyltransferase
VTALDQDRAEAFAGQMVGVLNDAMLALMVSIGHRTGLYDAISGHSPASSVELAEAAGLNERYVREWLGAMVAGGIVDYDPKADTYVLPLEHAASLTRTAGPGNLAAMAQFVALLGQVEGPIVDHFHKGGGVGYEAFPDFQAVMADNSSRIFDATLLTATVPLVDGLTDRLTAGIDVADIGCGRGHALCILAEAFPASRFTGIDVSADAITTAQAAAKSKGLTNIDFETRDAAHLDLAGAFDLITTFDAVHDQADPARVLRAIHAALRPGGVYLAVDIRASSDVGSNRDHPLGPFLYTVSCMHCMTVSLARDGAGLGAMWGQETALAMLSDAGFDNVEVLGVDGDIVNTYYIARKP